LVTIPLIFFESSDIVLYKIASITPLKGRCL
jgi:hypothetical protein